MTSPTCELADTFAVQPGELHYVWNECIPLLSRALARSGHERTIDYVLEQLMSKHAQLWCACDRDGTLIGALVTQVEELGDGEKACRLWLVGGKSREKWLHALTEEIEPWAKSIGCTSVRFSGRRGWRRVLPGYVQTQISLEKSLVV